MLKDTERHELLKVWRVATKCDSIYMYVYIYIYILKVLAGRSPRPTNQLITLAGSAPPAGHIDLFASALTA